MSYKQKKPGKLQRIPHIKPQNGIISSDFVDFKPMVPSYIKEKPNMFLLLSMEYARQWHSEKNVHEKSINDEKREEEYVSRKYVKKGLNRKKQNFIKCH
ncbi:hypothetical protein LSTR_LSTR001065 [Laodelphax striatellus]|uniref:Uncharacterized protein n=1 Tax=Laodelphax striatellus TaxID=195883 RepID=A0A482X140_LAOST|nr:hypothetical protein LSTR_LSTR001065 [Laodelphax striatellus]